MNISHPFHLGNPPPPCWPAPRTQRLMVQIFWIPLHSHYPEPLVQVARSSDADHSTMIGEHSDVNERYPSNRRSAHFPACDSNVSCNRTTEAMRWRNRTTGQMRVGVFGQLANALSRSRGPLHPSQHPHLFDIEFQIRSTMSREHEQKWRNIRSITTSEPFRAIEACIEVE